MSDLSSPSASSSRPISKIQRSTADYSLSCAECRRLKLKCSRQQWPCDTCIKRGIPHLCPDGIQKKEKNRAVSSLISAKDSLSMPSHRTNTSNDVGRTTDQAIYLRLDSLEKKIDRLIEGSQGSTSIHRPDLPFNGSLHDLASIATDHYTMKNGQANSSLQDEDDTTRQQHGTLTLHADGRAHYMGSNAHSMYLAQDKPDGRRVSFREELLSRPGSPTPIDLEAAASHPNSSSTNSRKKADVGLGTSPEGNTPSTVESQPAQLVWATPGFRSPHSSTAIWNHLKQVMPSAELALRMIEVYYATATFMFHPITRADFDATIWSAFYSSPHHSSYTPPANFHPHKLALLYSMLSVGVLLDVKRPQRDPVGKALYSCAWSALSMSNFTEFTSLEAILALMHINMYLTWRRGGKYAESAYPLLGTMMRMAVSTGLHRDPAQFNLQEEEREKRRRVFWDIQCSEVFRAFAFCRPPALCDRHVDTRLPLDWQLPNLVETNTMPTLSSRREGVFHAIKCRQIQLVNRMLDECLCQNSTYHTTIQFDKSLRQLYDTMPSWMLPELVELSSDSFPVTISQDLEMSYTNVTFREEMILEMQRHTTLLNHHQALLLLHRGWFSQALQFEEESPDAQTLNTKSTPFFKEERLIASIDAVNESASQMIAVTISAWSKYPALVIRWAFFWNSIFSAAVCRGLFVLKNPKYSTESEKAWIDLQLTINLFSKAVVGWAPLESPLSILKRLYKRAEIVINGKTTQQELSRGGTSAESEGEDLELIGNERKKRRRNQDGQSTPRKRNTKRMTAAAAAKFVNSEEQHVTELYSDILPSSSSTILDNTSDATFDLSQIQSSPFIGMDFHSSLLPSSIYANTVNNNTDEPSASQLIQMLSSGLSWDDVSSWNDLIVDL